MIRVSSMRSRIPNLRRGAACALSLAFLAGVPLAAPAQTTYSSFGIRRPKWIPAFAGMTASLKTQDHGEQHQ